MDLNSRKLVVRVMSPDMEALGEHVITLSSREYAALCSGSASSTAMIAIHLRVDTHIGVLDCPVLTKE